MPVAKVRAVLWDADGVLQQGVRAWPEVFADIVGAGHEAFGVEVWDDLASALRGELDMSAHVEALIEEHELGDRREAILGVWGMLEPLPESLGLLAAVRARGTACYLATNQDNLRASWMRRQMGYEELLDGSYYSCEVGAAKPEAAYFLRLADDLALAPRELLFIDDQPENVEAAREIGLVAVQWHHSEGVTALEKMIGLYLPD